MIKIICDNCGKTDSDEWRVLEEEEKNKHFCSKKCLKEYAFKK